MRTMGRWTKRTEIAVGLAITNLVCSCTRRESHITCWALADNTLCLRQGPLRSIVQARLRLDLRGGSFLGKCKNIYSNIIKSTFGEFLSARKRNYRSLGSPYLSSNSRSLSDRRDNATEDADYALLDPRRFESTLAVWALRLPAQHVAAARGRFGDFVLRRPPLRPVVADESDPAMRVLLLDPGTVNNSTTK